MKFSWNKKGMVFDASNLNLSWASHSAITPMPIKISDEVIRVYAGFRDKDGISRIGYVDVDFNNPKMIINVSKVPCLDIGKNGRFDDNGVILGDVVMMNDCLRMYYVGFQIVKNVKFLAFSGLAISSDQGETFQRYQDFPILDRGYKANTINAIHSVLYHEKTNIYSVFHAKGDAWQNINGAPFPQYNIWCSSSSDGININNDATLCVDVSGDEYRIGRPSVYKFNDYFLMFYTKGTTSGLDYYPGVALSKDGIDWHRQDSLFDLGLSSSGWDSLHLSYPRLIKITENKFYVFYNGNHMGRDGFGYAELIIEN